MSRKTKEQGVIVEVRKNAGFLGLGNCCEFWSYWEIVSFRPQKEELIEQIIEGSFRENFTMDMIYIPEFKKQ